MLTLYEELSKYQNFVNSPQSRGNYSIGMVKEDIIGLNSFNKESIVLARISKRQGPTVVIIERLAPEHWRNLTFQTTDSVPIQYIDILKPINLITIFMNLEVKLISQNSTKYIVNNVT